MQTEENKYCLSPIWKGSLLPPNSVNFNWSENIILNQGFVTFTRKFRFIKKPLTFVRNCDFTGIRELH